MILTILGAPVTKKNSQRILRGRGGRPFVSASSQYKAWANTAILQLQAQYRRASLGDKLAVLQCDPVNVRALIYRARRVGDANNYYAAIADVLEAAGVVENDRLCVSWDGSRMLIDRHVPRVEITLTPAELSDTCP